MMTETDKRYEKASDFTVEEKQLLILRDELYVGSWIKFLDDLKDRLKGRPYVYVLHNRIEKDIERIDTLQRYEFKYGINLADIVKIEDSPEDASKKEGLVKKEESSKS